jgi:multidrug resistance efflux pump
MPKSAGVRCALAIAAANVATKRRRSGYSCSHFLKKRTQRLKTRTYTVGQLQRKYKKELRTSIGDFNAQRSILRSSTSALYQTARSLLAAPRVSDVLLKHAKITAPYSKWVNANDYTRAKRTLALLRPKNLLLFLTE